MPLHRSARLAPPGGSPLPCDLSGKSASRPLALTCVFAALILALLCPAELYPQASSESSTPRQQSANISALDLPEAPLPAADHIPLADAITAPSLTSSTIASVAAPVALKDCPYDRTHAPECRVHWKQLLISSTLFLTWQNTANLYSGYWYRYETTHGDWIARYAASVTGYKYSVWSDGNPWLDDYIGHPLMGAITNALWIQNDPKGMTLAFSNSRPYWRSRLRAFEFTTIYSTQWKLGPIGESGIGHMGDHLAADAGRIRNETGFVSLVTTPVGGTLWTVTEDVLDEKLITHLEGVSRNPFLLVTYQFLNPARATGNLLRFRPPWYRDDRRVKANSFWSDPDPQADVAALPSYPREEPNDGPHAASHRAYISTSPPIASKVPDVSTGYVTRPTPSERGPTPGGTHELGAWWGLSLFSGPLWGYSRGVKYMPIDVRYSYRFALHQHWALRYSPEITALAMLDWPTPNGAAPFNLRQRAYGSGLSPLGLQLDLLPHHRVQPFLSHDDGFVYFAHRVLSPEGSRYMYTLDLGAGVNIFRKQRQAVTIGYRYQHLSNLNISPHNPGTDANTFYVGVSRFRNRRGDSP